MTTDTALNPPRTRPDKSETIIKASATTFAAYGYDRTQMTDISRAANVALGTLYRYSASKKELFLSAFLFAIGISADDASAASKNAGAEINTIMRIVREWLETAHYTPYLENALRAEAPSNGKEELPVILGEVYECIEKYYLAIRMLDRSAREWPELCELFTAEVRRPLLQKVEQYLEKRSAENKIRHISDAHATARLIVENCAWFAMHRKLTPGPLTISDETAKETTITFLTSGLQT